MKSNQDLREQLDYWDAEMDRYDAAGDHHAHDRARRMFLMVESELIERTQGDEPLDLN